MFSHIVRQWFTRSFLVAESSFFLKGKTKSEGSLHVLCHPLHPFLQGVHSFSSAAWLLEVNQPLLLGAGWLWGQGGGEEPSPGFPTGQGAIEKSRGVTNAPAFSSLERRRNCSANSAHPRSHGWTECAIQWNTMISIKYSTYQAAATSQSRTYWLQPAYHTDLTLLGVK